VKQFASDLVVNPSTVAWAMRELEHLGVIVSYAGRGSFVAQNAAQTVATNVASETFSASLDAAFKEARDLGVDAKTARDLLERAFETVCDEQKAERSCPLWRAFACTLRPGPQAGCWLTRPAGKFTDALTGGSCRVIRRAAMQTATACMLTTTTCTTIMDRCRVFVG